MNKKIASLAVKLKHVAETYVELCTMGVNELENYLRKSTTFSHDGNFNSKEYGSSSKNLKLSRDACSLLPQYEKSF
jgi:hypothetical protein